MTIMHRKYIMSVILHILCQMERMEIHRFVEQIYGIDDRKSICTDLCVIKMEIILYKPTLCSRVHDIIELENGVNNMYK